MYPTHDGLYEGTPWSRAGAVQNGRESGCQGFQWVWLPSSRNHQWSREDSGVVVESGSDGSRDVNERNNQGATPLMLACAAGHLKVAEILLSEGANLAASDTEGRNCLDYAAQCGNDKSVAWLLE